MSEILLSRSVGMRWLSCGVGALVAVYLLVVRVLMGWRSYEPAQFGIAKSAQTRAAGTGAAT
jgi:predicted negative regulator of RcsB-dependent stress response